MTVEPRFITAPNPTVCATTLSVGASEVITMKVPPQLVSAGITRDRVMVKVVTAEVVGPTTHTQSFSSGTGDVVHVRKAESN